MDYNCYAFRKFLLIAMEQIIGSWHKFLKGWELEDWVISPDYSSSVEQGDEEDDITESEFRKK